MSLIDEKEANRILKFCNKNVKSGSLELKKTKIKTIFRGNEQVKKGKKTLYNPYWSSISKHQLDLPLNLTEKEFIIGMNEITREIPDYVKFANLKLRFPDKIQEYLEKIKKNIENNKSMFDLGLKFENEGEVVEYLNKISYLNNNEQLNLLINKFYAMAVKENLIKDNTKKIENIKKWSLIDLYSEANNIEASSNVVIKYAYIKTHTDMSKDISNTLALDILIELLLKFSQSKLKIDDTELNKYVEVINSFKENTKKIELERKEKDKEYKKIIRDVQKDISNKEVELNSLKNKINSLEVELKEVVTQRDKINNLKNKNNELEKILIDEKLKCKQFEKSIKLKNEYYEYAFGIDEENDQKVFGIILSNDMDIKITKTIFNEVEFISLNEWKEKINSINIVYIQRQGISSRKLNEIKKYCSEHDITNKVISIDNEKTLIESISRIKHKERGI